MIWQWRRQVVNAIHLIHLGCELAKLNLSGFEGRDRFQEKYKLLTKKGQSYQSVMRGKFTRAQYTKILKLKTNQFMSKEWTICPLCIAIWKRTFEDASYFEVNFAGPMEHVSYQLCIILQPYFNRVKSVSLIMSFIVSQLLMPFLQSSKFYFPRILLHLPRLYAFLFLLFLELWPKMVRCNWRNFHSPHHFPYAILQIPINLYKARGLLQSDILSWRMPSSHRSEQSSHLVVRGCGYI
jgi:hypothetical protein